MYSQSHSLTTITYNSNDSYSRLIVTRASAAEEFTITPGSEVPRNITNNSVESTSTEEMLTHTGWLGDDESIVRCSGTKLLSAECIMLSGVGRLQCGSYIAQEFVAIQGGESCTKYTYLQFHSQIHWLLLGKFKVEQSCK